ncbi:MAG TPA: MBL fold metallo-hydrolase [Sphingopyxis sp.]|nr:MBL fold metallo-hydrolase [Sphingopyxis sp.]
MALERPSQDDDIPVAPRSPDMSLTQDDSFTATSRAGLTYPWGDAAPAPGKTIAIAPGIHWARIPMPGSLGHINSWLLDDGDDLAVVDTGLCLRLCSDGWKALFADGLSDRQISRIICTHLHPDHIGLAGWLAKKFDAPIWMTRGEMLTARTMIADTSEIVPDEVMAQSRGAGWNEQQLETFKASGWGRFRAMIYPLPRGYTRIQDGEILQMGAHQWRVVPDLATARNMPACGMKKKACWSLAIRCCRASVPTSLSPSPNRMRTRWANGWPLSTNC